MSSRSRDAFLLVPLPRAPGSVRASAFDQAFNQTAAAEPNLRSTHGAPPAKLEMVVRRKSEQSNGQGPQFGA